MSTATNDPLDQFAAAIASALEPALLRALEQAFDAREERADTKGGWRMVDVDEAAEMLALSPDAVRRIADCELPRRYVGPRRGGLRYVAADVIRYAVGLPPLQIDDEAEKRLAPKPLPKSASEPATAHAPIRLQSVARPVALSGSTARNALHDVWADSPGDRAASEGSL